MSEAKNLKMMGLVWNLFGYGKLLGASPKEEFTLILESDDTAYGKLLGASPKEEFTLILASDDTTSRKESCLSGLKSRTRNAVYASAYRGFESLTFR